MGERVPQHVQNIVIRDYCQKNNYRYLLSGTEYVMHNSTSMLQKLINELHSIDGIVTYSLFQLPKDNKKRNFYINKVLSEQKEFHFACENLFICDLNSFEKIENIWRVRKTLEHCPKRI